MFGYQACHVCAQLEHVFSVTCPRLDENDGNLNERKGMFHERWVETNMSLSCQRRPLLILRLLIALERNERVIFERRTGERDHREVAQGSLNK